MAGLPVGLDPCVSLPVIHVQTNGDRAVPDVESGEPFAHVGSYYSPALTSLYFGSMDSLRTKVEIKSQLLTCTPFNG